MQEYFIICSGYSFKNLRVKFGDEFQFRGFSGVGYFKEFRCKSKDFYCDGVGYFMFFNWFVL